MLIPLTLKPATPPPQLPNNKPISELSDGHPDQKNNLVTVRTKSCTVRLEILTESDIIKHIHVHQEVMPKNNMKTMVTVEMAHFTRLCVKPKPTQSSRSPQSVSQNVDYIDLNESDAGDQSPTPKCKHANRPKREPSSS